MDINNYFLEINFIAINMFAQVNPEGKIYVLFDKVIDNCTCVTNTKLADSFVNSDNGDQHRLQTTKG